jgi:hypothetical protein
LPVATAFRTIICLTGKDYTSKLKIIKITLANQHVEWINPLGVFDISRSLFTSSVLTNRPIEMKVAV